MKWVVRRTDVDGIMIDLRLLPTILRIAIATIASKTQRALVLCNGDVLAAVSAWYWLSLSLFGRNLESGHLVVSLL